MGGVIRQIDDEEKLLIISCFCLKILLLFVSAFVYFDGFGWFVFFLL